ncbi:MAG: PIN domain nuclease [Anaerolinea sp.]|nr:PIN domain nuclease [Anaerolinea sp.]
MAGRRHHQPDRRGVGRGVVILADTHAWIWYVNADSRLSGPARAALEREDLGIAGISLWEVALLSQGGRIRLDGGALHWIQSAVNLAQTSILHFTPEIAVLSAGFGDTLHRDPADRIIVATALHHGTRLVTADRAITQSGLVRTVW